MTEYKITRKNRIGLDLVGIMQETDLSNGLGKEISRVNGKEESLKFLGLCDDKGFMNPGGYFQDPELDTDSQRITTVFYRDFNGREVPFSYEDFVKFNKALRIFCVSNDEYVRSE